MLSLRWQSERKEKGKGKKLITGDVGFKFTRQELSFCQSSTMNRAVVSGLWGKGWEQAKS